jgi:S-DNA-T family DNA segregation ATPase FtsK/SpoIIIE
LEPSQNAGRALLRNNPPLEFQTANCCFKEKSLEDILEIYNSFAQLGRIKPAMPIPQMPDIVDIFSINQQQNSPLINIGLLNDNLQPTGIDLNQNHLFLVTGEPGSGKSNLLISMANLLLQSAKAKIYVKDSASVGLYPLLSKDKVVNLDELSDDDGYTFVEEISALLDERRSQLLECRKSGGDLAALKDGWEQTVFIIDDLLDFADNGDRSLLDLMERIAKKEHGLKMAIWAGSNISDISSSYDSLVKLFKNCGCGVLFGSIKDQGVFNIRVPYGSYEKTEFEIGEGYFVLKNKYWGIKAAADISLL